MSSTTPRIPPLPRSQWTDEARDVFAVFGGADAWENGPPYDFVRILAQYPALTRPFLTYNRHLLLHSTLETRHRELVTLYVGWTCKSAYEWLSHVREGLRNGLQDADFDAIKQGPDSPHWSELERNLLRLVDEIRDSFTISDALWDALAAHFDHRGMMDLIFTIGNYLMVSAIVNGLRVQPEAGSDGADFVAKYGTP